MKNSEIVKDIKAKIAYQPSEETKIRYIVKELQSLVTLIKIRL